MGWWPWLLHTLGVDDVSGRAYAFWSGFGSDLGEATLLAGLVAYLRHRNCHQYRCWRLGRFPVASGQYVTCRRHHPDPAVRAGITAHHLSAVHHAHLRHLHHPAPPGGSPHDPAVS